MRSLTTKTNESINYVPEGDAFCLATAELFDSSWWATQRTDVRDKTESITKFSKKQNKNQIRLVQRTCINIRNHFFFVALLRISVSSSFFHLSLSSFCLCFFSTCQIHYFIRSKTTHSTSNAAATTDWSAGRRNIVKGWRRITWIYWQMLSENLNWLPLTLTMHMHATDSRTHSARPSNWNFKSIPIKFNNKT